MRYKVLLTEDAERDLEDIYTYVAEFDSQERADHVLDRLLDTADSLITSAERGVVPRELQSLGIREYQQVFFKPYRIIYRVIEKRVIVYLVVDGRRDVESVLARRLLGA